MYNQNIFIYYMYYYITLPLHLLKMQQIPEM